VEMYFARGPIELPSSTMSRPTPRSTLFPSTTLFRSIFLARGLSPVADHARHTRRDEEADMQLGWFDLDDAVAMVFRGEITNGPCVAGLLAAARARSEGWRPLRPPTSPVAR